MIVIFCRNAFLLIEINAFEAFTSKTASNDYISCIACANDSHPTSCPAQTCNEPTSDIISHRICDTTMLLAI